ncbi:MAG: alpha/beta hydrolase [Clostridia bacterium]|nr:alpha/beta hydrolase [Clostridia bacterium]
MNKLYARGIVGQYFYNFTELLAYAVTYRPTPYELVYTKKLKYGDEKFQYINTYSRKDILNKKKPLFIYIHGGGWISGITEMRNAYISEWAKKGFFTASVSYTYAPQKVFPGQLHEIFSAIDFILDHADEYNIDTENIVIGGESAGGYYVAYVASCMTDKTIFDKLNICFRHMDSFNIKAIVSHCGCYDLKRLTDPQKKQSRFPDMKMMISSFSGMPYDKIKELLNTKDGDLYSPQINEHFPPSFITWGDKDLLRYEAFDFAESLRSNNVKYHLFKSDGIIGMHAWSIVLLFEKSRKCLADTFDFVLPYVCDYFEKDKENNWSFIRNKII